MTLIGILLALLFERLLGHLPGWGRPVLFMQMMRIVHRVVPRVLWDSAALPLLILLIATAGMFWLQQQVEQPLLSVAFSAVVLLLCLGPRDLSEDIGDLLRAREAGDLARVAQLERALQRGPSPGESHRSLLGSLFIQSHEKLFGVLLWFFALGPAGAVAYRVASRLPRALAELEPGGRAQDAAASIHGALAFIPARVTAALFGLAGSLDDALGAWRGLALQPEHGWRTQTWAVLAEVSSASLRSEEADGGASVPASLPQALQEVRRMQTRALLILLAFFAFFTTGGAL